MDPGTSQRQKLVLATLSGALIGGLLVALATKALPRIMAGMLTGMMKNDAKGRRWERSGDRTENDAELR